MAQGRHISAQSVLGYTLLPRVIPRAKHLFASGFTHVAFLMAHIYAMVRLLPAGHPYLQSQNIGKFGVRHVIAAAANNLILDRKHIDQVIIFVAMLTAAALIALQVFSLVYAFLFQPAMAQISFFNTPEPETDVALNLLDRMFGVPDLFCNIAGQCTQIEPTLPTAFHNGLHSMLQFYSLGILVVGVLIFLYFVVVVVGETAMTGTPFGQRFQNIWVPIRLVVAIGLLLPLNYGLNSAQYITLYAAKWGSGFATNGWIQFNRAIANQGSVFGGQQFGAGGANPLGEKESLIARPRAPDFTPVIQFVSMAHACFYSYGADSGLFRSIRPYFIKQPFPGAPNQASSMPVTQGTSYNQGLDFYNYGDIVIRFGEQDSEKYKEEKGFVNPTCGEIRLHIEDVSNRGQWATSGGPDLIQKTYFELILKLWFNDQVAKNLAYRHVELETTGGDPCVFSLPGGNANCDTDPPPASVKQRLINDYNSDVEAIVYEAWDRYRMAGAGTELTKEMYDRGWGGAGIWYNIIARINGGFINAVESIPSASFEEYPEIMVKVRKEREGEDNEIIGSNMFDPNFKSGKELKSLRSYEVGQARKLSNYFKYWSESTPDQSDSDKISTSNTFKSAMNMIFGTSGLFAMREENATIHPLAQLSALGKGLVDNAVRNIGLASGASFMGGILEQFKYPKGAAAAEITSNILSSTAFIGLTAGVILFYILPFMPFLYFFFAVGEWVKGIFEAMVGVPLWALAHLRLDGEGLPGDSASTGYFLIFEIFVRPILILFGLIAAMVIFTAQVRILHFIWDIVVANLTGYEKDPLVDLFGMIKFSRGIIDEFFFTVIYAIIVYMLATASFKLIDAIPDKLLRYMGASTPSFGDMQNDATLASLNQYVATGGIAYGEQAVSGITSSARSAGRGVGGILNAVGNLGRSGGGGAAPPPAG